MLRGIVDHKQPGLLALGMQVGRNSAGPRWIPVAPDIAVDDQKSLVLEKIQGPRDVAGGFQSLCFGRIRYARHKVAAVAQGVFVLLSQPGRSAEHTSALQSLMRISYACFFL